MKRTSLFLDEKLLDRLKRAADRRGVSVAQLVREAVAVYLAGTAAVTTVPAIAGQFASGLSDGAERADELLWKDPHA